MAQFLGKPHGPSLVLLLFDWLLGTLLLLERLFSLWNGPHSNRSGALRFRLGSVMHLLDLRNSLVEGLALSGGNLELKRGGLTRTVGTL